MTSTYQLRSFIQQIDRIWKTYNMIFSSKHNPQCFELSLQVYILFKRDHLTLGSSPYFSLYSQMFLDGLGTANRRHARATRMRTANCRIQGVICIFLMELRKYPQLPFAVPSNFLKKAHYNVHKSDSNFKQLTGHSIFGPQWGVYESWDLTLKIIPPKRIDVVNNEQLLKVISKHICTLRRLSEKKREKERKNSLEKSRHRKSTFKKKIKFWVECLSKLALVWT